MQNVEKQIINGKEYTVVKLQHQPKHQPSGDEQLLEEVATVCYYYPQYTLEDIYERLPAYQVSAMIKVARREQANQLLLLNGIIHGPNAKRQEQYRKLIKNLQNQAK